MRGQALRVGPETYRQQLGRLKSERTAAADQAPRAIPHPTLITADFGRMLGILSADPTRGREILSRFVAPLVMTPEGKNPDRSYRATGAFDLGFFLGPSREGFGKSSCAGAIRAVEHVGFREIGAHRCRLA